MSAFLGAIGFVGIIVGIVLMVIGRIKKRKYRGGIIAIISVILFIVGVATTPDSVGNTKKADQTDTHKVTPGKITNKHLLIDLAVRSETLIEKYDKIDNVKVDEDNITAQKMVDQKDTTGKIYKNVYKVTGQYSWKDRRYDYELIISYKKNNIDESGSVLKYESETSGPVIDVNLTTAK
ncbi:MAG: hypothetical protein LKH78_03315 [Weizmannia coagulans]|jgi:hypothetical protein|nr:hypothetical protein [Heyndrickxia coagulans]